ncbi:MAG: DEAD/DEAH box helicase family protein [Candidatus Dehalobacter alkaniphilus]
MRVTISNSILIENPSVELIQWCKGNLVLDNPEYLKKQRMGFWTGNVSKRLALYEHRGDSLILPFGTLREILPIICDGQITTDFKDAREIDYKCDVSLYDYQKIAVDALVEAHYGILQSRAASGKTQMGIALVGKLGRKTLWLTHTKDLLKQSMDRAKAYIDNSLIGTITEGKVNIGRGITFATVQTMCKLDLAQYLHEWDVIIVDEVHRVCGSPTAMSMFYKVLNSLSARHKYGLSATVHRADGLIKATYALVGGIVYTVPDEAIGDRIMPVSILPVYTGIQLGRECLNTDGTLAYGKLINYLCEHALRNRIIVANIVENAPFSSLILSDRLEHLRSLMAMLPDSLRKQAVMVDGTMTSKKAKAEREKALEDMRNGKKRFLFATFALAKEGLDLPILERLYLTTPQTDYAVVTQSTGRIARTAEDKDEPIAYDYVDDMRFAERAFKKRCTIYKKNGYTIIEP